MKKILILLLPMLMVIAVIFFIRNKNFDSHTMLEFISNFRFENFVDNMQETRNIIGDTINTFKSLAKPKNPIDFLSTIVEGVIFIVRSCWCILTTLFNLITDTISNVLNIFDWLFVS